MMATPLLTVPGLALSLVLLFSLIAFAGILLYFVFRE